MPQGEGFEKGSISPFIIDADLSDSIPFDILSQMPKGKQDDKFDVILQAKPFKPNFL